MTELPAVNLKEDSAGASPPNVSGERESKFFDKSAADHDYRLERMRMGMYGVFGTRDAAPNNIAFITLFLSVAVAVSCLIASARVQTDEAKFLQSFAERAFAIVGTCLGFVFGRSTALKSQE